MSIQTHASRLCVHDLTGARASAAPNAIALVAGDQRLTYGELDVRANRLAHHLRSLGVGSEVLVGLCAPRSFDLVVGALGILKAGGAYVPLDPAYPPKRLSMLLDDSRAPLVLTQPRVAAHLHAGRWRTVLMDADGTETARYPKDPPPATATLESLAYVVFTSGSTGRPKGVQITHASLLNLVSWHQRTFKITPADRSTLQASPGFDAAVWELWPYLTAGASLHVVDDALRTAPAPLRDWMVAQGITLSFLPTALAQEMMDLRWPRETALRTLLTGADTLRRYPPADLPFAVVNNYGPTECTVVATSGTIPPGAQTDDDPPPIGRPIDNTRIYIVDEQLKPVPAGTSGEVLIGGAGVAQGYLHHPELTAERFIPDPFSEDPRLRVYRTGDLARQLPDGQIAFLGRTDEQIKISGYRVEPREITALLDRHPAVKTSVVAASSDAAGGKRLVAYVVPAGEGRVDARALQAFLREHVPDYMVPVVFVQLERLPLSAHGKLDRAALPALAADHDDPVEAPRSVVETRVAGVLTTLLGVTRIGHADNFFELGGHSLLGAQMIARVRDIFGVELPLRTLFDHPTVQGISAEIERLTLAKVEAMTEDEAQRLLGSWQGGRG
jgi:amino acid adenylation domain-containing protein